MQTQSGGLLQTFSGVLKVTIEGMGTVNIQGIGEPLAFIAGNAEMVLGAGTMIMNISGDDCPYELVSFDPGKAELVVRKK